MFELIIPFIPTISYPDEEAEMYENNSKLFLEHEDSYKEAKKEEGIKKANLFLNKYWNGPFYIEEINFGENEEYGLDDAMKIIFSIERN